MFGKLYDQQHDAEPFPEDLARAAPPQHILSANSRTFDARRQVFIASLFCAARARSAAVGYETSALGAHPSAQYRHTARVIEGPIAPGPEIAAALVSPGAFPRSGIH